MKTELTEGKLIDKLYTSHLVVWYTLFCIQAMPKAENKNDLSIKTPQGDVFYKDLEIDHLTSEEIKNTIHSLSLVSTCSNYLKESFRVTQDYCNKYGYSEDLYKETWYRFAKILVNCLSHDLIFSFDRLNPKHLPATYEDVTITKDMEGKTLPEEFTAQMFVNLADEIIKFVIRTIPEGGKYNEGEEDVKNINE